MESIWLDPKPAIPTDPFEPGGHYDTVVAGAGLTGLVTALLLSRAGQRVAVIDSRFVGAGTSGHSTAKLSLLQGTTLQQIHKNFSAEVVHAYVEGNSEGQAWLRQYLDEHSVPHQTRDAFTYAVEAKHMDSLEQEASISHEAGLQVRVLEGPQTGLPFSVAGAITLPDQIQLDPVAVITQLCADLRSRGGRIFEDTRLKDSTNSSPLQITTSRGQLGADHLILATGTPVLDRGGYFAKLEPSRSYAAAYASSPGAEPFPHGMYLSVDSPSRSLRTAIHRGREVLLVGGNSHPVGSGVPREAARDLERWAREHFTLGERTHAWSAQDYRSINSVPFVGKMPRSGGKILVATGYNKWGMTNAVASALRLSATILGGQLPWAEVLGHRVSGPTALAEAGKLNATVAKDLLYGWAHALTTSEKQHGEPEDEARSAKEKPPTPDSGIGGTSAENRGKVVREGLHPVAVSTLDGRTCRVSAICTHLGGILTWNDEEASWDCPLHGSRFTPAGTVIEGPATDDLKPAD
ncbi:FAD-dependent oxidoreductase [Paeniglutamicibacter gangotriensis]|uniref:Rieske [2Fe-2S] iron-sulfur protein n=1 Tax=Paeniglutamicibacter gangotriensis Lz1y TaxID=1276920 RepID=M7N8V0_9MICC|nr:FAD-dependent oxidoreductase [Paeniglutamicibacter gangotriensis]EMQ98199.1 Rieske [2Fe-2S] iron-sulfur protein [Paeniglutamicibacter gangotriensis Lz1y]